MNNDDLPPIESLEGAEGAFIRSAAGYYFAGEKLEPFSSRRRRAAGCLGLRWGRLSDGDLEKFRSGGSYDGIEQDAVILLWLCHQTPERCSRAMRYPSEALAEMDDWADGAGVSLGEPHHAEAITLFVEIMMDVFNSQPAADGESEAEGEGDTGKPTPVTPPSNSSRPGRLGAPLITSDGTFRSPPHGNTSTFIQPAKAGT